MDNLFEKINQIVDIDEINSKNDFDEYISNLTNHPTPLREAVAYKLEDLFKDEFIDDNIVEIILNAIIDINPNVSRSICKVIDKNPKLQLFLEEKIINKIENILKLFPNSEIKQNNKSHAKNKLLFSLYWLMESLYYCASEKYKDKIIEILNITIEFQDYTIREKTAQLLTKLDNIPQNLSEKVKNDDNFYVNFYSKFI